MFESEEDRQRFLVKYNISQDRFRESLLSWDTLREIADDFEVLFTTFIICLQEPKLFSL